MKLKTLLIAMLLAIPSMAQERSSAFLFWGAQAASAGMTVLDIETTQHCLAIHTCKEGNPIMGSSRKQAYSVAGSMTAAQIMLSYLAWRDKKADHRWSWMIFPIVNGGIHGVGFWSGYRFRNRRD